MFWSHRIPRLKALYYVGASGVVLCTDEDGDSFSSVQIRTVLVGFSAPAEHLYVVQAGATLKNCNDVSKFQRPRIVQNNTITIKWNPPPLNTLKIKFDGSVRSDSAACGFVICDCNARPLLAATRTVGKMTVPAAEALALRDSLVIAKDRGYRNLEVEGDSKLVINAFNSVLELRGVI